MNELSSRVRAEMLHHGEAYFREIAHEPHGTADLQPLEAWFDVSFSPNEQDSWRRRFIAVSATTMLFFETYDSFLRKEPSRLISLGLLITCTEISTRTGDSTSSKSGGVESCIQINYVVEGETRVLPWMNKKLSNAELIRCHADHKASSTTSKSLYLRAASSQEKNEWLVKFRARLERCEYQGESGVAAEAMLRALQKPQDPVQKLG